MHINARDLPPSKAFCFIIEYPPYSNVGEKCMWAKKFFTNILFLPKYFTNITTAVILDQQAWQGFFRKGGLFSVYSG